MSKTDPRQGRLFESLRIKRAEGQMRRASKDLLIDPNGPPDPALTEVAYRRAPKMVHPCQWAGDAAKCYLHPDQCPNLIPSEKFACPRWHAVNNKS